MPQHHDSGRQDTIKQFFSNSAYQMVDVGKKPATHRQAIAQGRIFVGKNAFHIIQQKQLPKGDVLALAEIAGITGAKKTCDLIPLCHPLPLEQVSIHTVLEEETATIVVYCIVSAFAKTGVEMEALAGVNAALLTIYDLTKMVEPALALSDIRLLVKEGGKNGRWVHPDGIPTSLQDALTPQAASQTSQGISTAIITISDRAANGEYDDKSGAQLKTALAERGYTIVHYEVVPDNKQMIIDQLDTLVKTTAPKIIITTGGTGLSHNDITPEAVTEYCDRMIPGFGEILRKEGAQYTKYAWLSRCLAGLSKQTLIIALPGNPKAVTEGITILQDMLPHALRIINEVGHD